MSVKVTFEAANSTALYRAIADFLSTSVQAGPTAAEVAKEAKRELPPEPKPDKPKRTRRTKAEMAAAREAEAAAKAAKGPSVTTTEPTGEDAPQPIEPAEKVTNWTQDQVRAKIKEVHDKRGLRASMAVMNDRFAVQKVSDILERQYAEVIAYCDWVLAGGDPTAGQPNTDGS